MARSVSATFLTAQQAAYNTPYCKLIFTSKDGETTVDLSTDSSTYGNRILLIDHTEEPYDDFATIIFRNHDRAIPSVKGYWVEIGYGYTVSGADHYLGDGTNEGAPPRLWVKHQQTISAGGKLWEVLELEGMWAKLREQVIRLGDPPLYTNSYTTDTIYDIIGYILAELSMTLNALAEDDGIIDTLQPQFDLNAMPFEFAASIIYRLLNMTASYLKALDDLEFEIKYPQSGDSVDLTYYSNAAPYFYEYLERVNVLIPNHFLVFGNQGDDGLWTEYITSESPHGVDQTEIDAYDEIYKLILAGTLTEQDDVDDRADALLARAKFEQLSGRMYAPHDARVELYDRIAIEESRGASSDTYAEWTTWTDSLLAGDLHYALGNHIEDMSAGTVITKLKFYVKRVGSPAGNVQARIAYHSQANGTYLKDFGSPISCTSIGTSMEWIEFNDEYTLPDTNDYHIYLYFDGDHTFPTDYIAVAQYTPHTLGADYLKTTSLLYGGAFNDVAENTYIVLFSISYLAPTSYPSDAMSRVSSIRHIYQPGFFRMQVGLGDLGFDIDVAEASVRKALDTAEEVEEEPPPLEEFFPPEWAIEYHPTPRKELERYVCPYCGKVFTGPLAAAALWSHVQFEHLGGMGGLTPGRGPG